MNDFDDDDDLFDEIILRRLSGSDLPEMGLDAYRHWLVDVELPTDAQIEAFVDYVAGARSWYKHLPLTRPGVPMQFYVVGARSWYKHLPLTRPGVPMQFYIDPHAGMDRLVRATGEVRLCERTQETGAFHYSWMPTAEYRERFGCLAFSCAKGSALFTDEYLDGEPVLVDHNCLFPELRVASDAAFAPPRAVLDAGRCNMTALVHPQATAEFVARRLGTDADSVATFEQQKTELRKDMIAAIQRMCDVAFAA